MGRLLIFSTLTAMTEETTDIVRIGAGSFATVYVLGSRNHVALKCVADPSRCSELLAEFQSHRTIYGLSRGLAFKVPQPNAYYPSFAKFQQELWLADDAPAAVTSGIYSMERVWPVPPALSAKIRGSYFPEQHKDYRRGFICRLYLGMPPSRADRPSRFFNANNFPLSAKRCEELNLPASLLAAEMARMLARIHYCAGEFDPFSTNVPPLSAK